jgi:hypothetical protein
MVHMPHTHIIKWLGNSPDLNPVKMVWSWMKRQLSMCKATSTELHKVGSWWPSRWNYLYLKDLATFVQCFGSGSALIRMINMDQDPDPAVRRIWHNLLNM